MCTILAMRNVHREFPLVIAANRDEFYRRHALAPRALSERPRIVGGRDQGRGGTWMGVSHNRFFVGVTNQRTWKAADGALRSRGEVVLACLADGSIEAVTERLRALDARAYNPFNLMFGDVTGLRVAYVRHEDPLVRFEDLGDGVRAHPNDALGSPHFPKTDRIEARLRDPALATLPWEDLQPHLVAALADHELPDKDLLEDPPAGSLFPKFLARRLQALCVHTPAYGTVSSTLLAFGPGGVARYLYADGHPCETPFAPVAL
jgi:uncharacterized protein with NRDE domain